MKIKEITEVHGIEKVYTALKNDWFRDLGIMGKDEDYFYDKKLLYAI